MRCGRIKDDGVIWCGSGILPLLLWGKRLEAASTLDLREPLSTKQRGRRWSWRGSARGVRGLRRLRASAGCPMIPKPRSRGPGWPPGHGGVGCTHAGLRQAQPCRSVSPFEGCRVEAAGRMPALPCNFIVHAGSRGGRRADMGFAGVAASGSAPVRVCGWRTESGHSCPRLRLGSTGSSTGSKPGCCDGEGLCGSRCASAAAGDRNVPSPGRLANG